MRDPGQTPSPTSTVLHDIQPLQGPSRERTQARGGPIPHRVHCRAVRLARIYLIQQGLVETASRYQVAYRGKTPHKEKAHTKSGRLGFCV